LVQDTWYLHSRSFGTVYSYLFIPGDQIPTFDKFDGMHSTIVANLSSGLCRFTLKHSDIGGYNALISPSGSLVRDSQVSFSTNLTQGFLAMDRIGVIRRSVHEGNIPPARHQLYSSKETSGFLGAMIR
jgi:hypothetical protein